MEKWFDIKQYPIDLNTGIYLFTVEVKENGKIARMTLPGLLTRDKRYPNGWQICTYGDSYVFHSTEDGSNRLVAWRPMPTPYGLPEE